MAKKPRSQWSAAYRRRIERAERAGKTRQQARGHKLREHITRKENKAKAARRVAQRVAGPLTKTQKDRIKKFAREQHKRVDMTTGAFNHELITYAERFGFARLWDLIKTQRDMRKQYISEIRNHTWVSRGMGFMEMLRNHFEAPDVSWLYYH